MRCVEAWREARITGDFSLIHRDADGNAPCPSPGLPLRSIRLCVGHTPLPRTHTAEYSFMNTAAHKYRFCVLNHQRLVIHFSQCNLSFFLSVCEAVALRQGCCAAVYVCCRVRRLHPQLTHYRISGVNPVCYVFSLQRNCLLSHCDFVEYFFNFNFDSYPKGVLVLLKKQHGYRHTVPCSLISSSIKETAWEICLFALLLRDRLTCIC